MPSIFVRSQMIVNNPVAATYMFYRLIHKFFEIIVKLPLNDYTGRKFNMKN